MKLFRLEWMVFVAAAVVLSWNLWNTGIASGYIDPIAHFGAQDEATYTREAITMARDGGWMTPTFLGRWVFEKPPLLMWLSAASMKALGIGRVSARLPVVFAGALICAICFLIARRERSTGAGLAAAAMALSSQVLFIMARHNMTDILLAAAEVCAFAVLLRDPELRETRSFDGFVIAAAAGIMAKSIAGFLVLAVMIVVVGAGRRQAGRAATAAIAAIIVASPWFLYSYLHHRDWFLADMGFQIITIGTTARQTAQENHLWFYIVRILNSDPAPLLLALSGAPAQVRSVRRRESTGVLAAAFLIIYFSAMMVFHFHSEQYLTWFTPSLILIAAVYSPLLNRKGAPVAIAAILLLFVVRIANPQSDFGVSMRSGSTITAAPVLSRYCAKHRATDLYILGIDDEFYSALLPLHHVHYGWVDPTDTVAHEHPHLVYLGILVPADEFRRLSEKLPTYQARLRSWGLDSTGGIATGISAHNAASLEQIIRDHPESDFLVSRAVLPDPEQETSHRIAYADGDFALLESRLPAGTEPAAWSCEM